MIAPEFESSGLHPEIVQAIEKGYTVVDMPSVHFFNATCAGIVAATHVLRKQRLGLAEMVPLAEKQVAANCSDMFGGLLKVIINQSLQQQKQSDFAARRCKAYETTCAKADYYFGQAAASFEPNSKLLPRNLYGLRVISYQEKPLLLHKSEGSPSALSLAPITVAGITFPAGSIMGVHVDIDKQQKSGRYIPQLEAGTVQHITSEHIETIDFLRPSLFALPPHERLQFLDGFYKYRMPEATYQVENTSIEEVSAMAEHFVT